jgi:hypothetical protein
MPPVPQTAESLAVLRARYAAALEHVYDVEAIRRGAVRPGEVAANVFDFEDGLRLIVSRERYPDGEILLHFSASFLPKCRMADELRQQATVFGLDGDQLLQRWLADVPRRFVELSGDGRPLRFLGMSDHKIPHWVIEGDGDG